MSAARVPNYEAGQAIADWRITQALAPGNPALYLAHHADDSQRVALIKVFLKSARAIEMLRREVRLLRGLDHPAIPEVFDFGFSQVPNGVWVATEHFDGVALSEQQRAEPLDWKVACYLMHQLALALEVAHRHSIIVRGVQPDRVVLNRAGGVQFADFDLAMELADAQHASIDELQLNYVAPEALIDGAELGPESDVYALGVMLYEILTNKPAFKAIALGNREAASQALEWKTYTLLDPGARFPLWLVSLVQKATASDPNDRFVDAGGFAAALDEDRDAWEEAVPNWVDAPPENSAPSSPAPNLVAPVPTLRPALRPSETRAVEGPGPEAEVGRTAPDPTSAPLASVRLSGRLPVVVTLHALAAALGLLTGVVFGVVILLFTS